MKDYCNDWECPHNKDGVCGANADEYAECLDELLAAISRLKEVLKK